MQIYECEFLAVYHHTYKCGRHYESGCMFLICHMTSHDHMLYEWELLIVFHHLIVFHFGGHWYRGSRCMSLVHHRI